MEQFKDAREAFESITRKLSQATLNTYWDYHYPGNNTALPPDSYIRQSELRFISGRIPALSNLTGSPAHGIFFQAPLGFVNDTTFSEMESLLNTWGYFVEFGSDRSDRPDFINSLSKPPQERYRFRVMELMEPSESLTLYNAEEAAGGNSNYTGTDWFTTPLSGSPPYSQSSKPVRVLAENIVALILLPRLTPQEDPTGTRLSPNYNYDSTKTDDGNSGLVNAAENWKNQLPPVVQVTMVAVDEASFNRYIGNDTSMPDLLTSNGVPLFQSAANYTADLDALQKNLQKYKLSYRVFTTNVSLKAAKWSRAQQN